MAELVRHHVQRANGNAGRLGPVADEYSVTISAQLSASPFDQFNFTAGEIDDGRLDWASFDFNGEINMGTGNDRAFRDIVETTIPAPVTFRGGPVPRFWEMEDAKLAYGLLSVGPTDLVQLMMIEYASSYGNDWFVVPLDLPVGSITQVNSLVVTDTFGVKTLLQAIGTNVNVPANFAMWTPAFKKALGGQLPGPKSNCFFLPPTLGSVVDGATLEDVAFMRDEMANLVWAIERSVEGATEQPVRRSNGGRPHARSPRPAAACRAICSRPRCPTTGFRSCRSSSRRRPAPSSPGSSAAPCFSLTDPPKSIRPRARSSTQARAC